MRLFLRGKFSYRSVIAITKGWSCAWRLASTPDIPMQYISLVDHDQAQYFDLTKGTTPSNLHAWPWDCDRNRCASREVGVLLWMRAPAGEYRILKRYYACVV